MLNGANTAPPTIDNGHSYGSSGDPAILTSTACVGHGWQRHAAVGLGRTATSYQGGAGKNSAAAWLEPFWGTDGLVYPEVRMLPLGTFERNSVLCRTL